MDINEILAKIKDYADVAVEQAGRMGKTAASKTETTIQKAKLKYGIADLESKITELYAKIGEKIYSVYGGNGEAVGDVTEECEKINELNAEIKELKIKLSELSDTVKCDYCGKYNNAESVYCSKCGAKLAEEKIVTDSDEEDYEADVETDDEADDTADDDDTVIEVSRSDASDENDIITD